MALDQLLEPLEALGWLGGAHAGPDLDPKEVRRHRRLRVAAPRIDDAGGGDFKAVHPHSKLFGQAPHGHGFASAQPGEDELQRCRTPVLATSARGLVGDEAVSTGPNLAPHSAFPSRLRWTWISWASPAPPASTCAALKCGSFTASPPGF